MSHFASDHTVSNLSPHSGIIVLKLSRMLPVSWQCHTVVSDHTVSNLSPHSGMIVLMLSRMLPVSWQWHTVVSDHTAPNIHITNNTKSYNNHTPRYIAIRLGKDGAKLGLTLFLIIMNCSQPSDRINSP